MEGNGLARPDRRWKAADHVAGHGAAPTSSTGLRGADSLRLLLKNYRLSDDIAFRFSNHEWPEFPLTAEKFASWAQASGAAGDIINLFMDYETFGEHQWESTGIFQFMEALPDVLLSLPGFSFVHPPTAAAAMFQPVASLDVHNFMSWADAERDLTAWLGNDMQQDAITAVYRLEEGEGRRQRRSAAHLATPADIRPFLTQRRHQVVRRRRRA